MNPYNIRIKLKNIGVNIPNSFNKNPETYDPYWPKIFWVSKLDKLCQPVSLKLNEREDIEINIDNVNKITFHRKGNVVNESDMYLMQNLSNQNMH